MQRLLLLATRHIVGRSLRSLQRLLPLVSVPLLISTGRSAAQSVDTLMISAHAEVLAHDSLEGRGTGTRGERAAAQYIISQLKGLGIPGVGPDGTYLHPLPLYEATLGTDSRLTIGPPSHGEGLSFRPAHDFVLSPGTLHSFRDFAGRALFAGTAGHAATALSGSGSLEGQVIVLLGTLGREALTLVPDWTARGAAGVLLLIPDAAGFRSLSAAHGPTRTSLAAEVDNPLWQSTLPTLIAGPSVASALLAGAPLERDALDGSRPFTALPLDLEVEAQIDLQTKELKSSNIAALIEGHDPDLSKEYVVYTAHYDHLGIGAPDRSGDSIYNGFSDNAAGVAMLLSIAEVLQEDPPARSTIFLFATGEELGLLGSSYFVSDPPIPLEGIAAVINLDAGAPPAPPRNWRIAGGDLSTLGETARRVAARHGWLAEPVDASPNSDHWPFLSQGIPSIFIIPGQDWEGVSRAEKEALQYRWEHYHQPADEWHPDFPLSGLQRYADLALQIGLEIANDTTGRPQISPSPSPTIVR